MLIELIGALLFLAIPYGVYRFVRGKHERIVNIKPDLVLAELTRKEIASGRLVVDVPNILVIGNGN